MASDTSALDFFILEASGYIDGLDSLFGSAGSTGPNRDAFVRLTRALRGNSVMYRQTGVTTVATSLEQCARAFREGRLSWAPHVQSALTATIDDLRILVRNVRQWKEADDQRAKSCAEALDGLVPRSPTPSATVQAATEAGGRAYLALKARELAATLSRVAAQPGDPAVRGALLHDVRVLSGVALLREFPVLSRVVSGLGEMAASLAEGATPTEDTRGQLRWASSALGTAAGLFEHGDAEGAERSLRDVAQQFEGAGPTGPAERIVAIDELFYRDEGPTVVDASASPPTSAAERFRIEVVSLAEHARRVIGDVRRAPDESERDRGWRALERAFGSLAETARSFGETAVAGALGAWERAVAKRDADTLGSLDAAAEALADPELPRSTLHDRVGRPVEEAPAAEEKAVDAPPAVAAAPDDTTASTPAPAETPAVALRGEKAAKEEKDSEERAPAPRPRSRTPTGLELRDLLQSGISGFDDLEQRPLAKPVPLAQERVVPIETLLYRGDSALKRARELRDEIKAGGASPPPEALDELFALLDLVRE
jgi:chemotaxis protein histidine kinase CheA